MRYFVPHGLSTPSEVKPKHFAGGGIHVGQDPDYPHELVLPPMWGGGIDPMTRKAKTIPLKKGGVAFGVNGYQFYHAGPGEYFDIPDEVPVKTVKELAPQILTKNEAFAAGLCNDDGSPKPITKK